MGDKRADADAPAFLLQKGGLAPSSVCAYRAFQLPYLTLPVALTISMTMTETNENATAIR